MSLPPMDPTGAMSSGDYVNYMIGYLNTAMDSEATQLEAYLGGQVLDSWSSQWVRQVADLSAEVVALNVRVNKLRAQASMATDAIGKL